MQINSILKFLRSEGGISSQFLVDDADAA